MKLKDEYKNTAKTFMCLSVGLIVILVAKLGQRLMLEGINNQSVFNALSILYGFSIVLSLLRQTLLLFKLITENFSLELHETEIKQSKLVAVSAILAAPFIAANLDVSWYFLSVIYAVFGFIWSWLLKLSDLDQDRHVNILDNRERSSYRIKLNQVNSRLFKKEGIEQYYIDLESIFSFVDFGIFFVMFFRFVSQEFSSGYFSILVSILKLLIVASFFCYYFWLLFDFSKTKQFNFFYLVVRFISCIYLLNELLSKQNSVFGLTLLTNKLVWDLIWVTKYYRYFKMSQESKIQSFDKR